ncbi:hypothetical protein B0T21DRAFT_328116 [Apiosordaria backusii]|uniref:Uncharacterized protein n=1 Tax=Apiosordaria backusii TaxID=314023 RepID=A0AA40EN37_9PEZI|nr:hypothetical protein B0T21DRAFT_328116 [Apiosordaria backusii]
MPSFSYHLIFELYATPDPTNSAVADNINDIWVPTPTCPTIFDDLPSHTPRSTRPPSPRQLPSRSRHPHNHDLDEAGPSSAPPPDPSYTSGKVIDCGRHRGTTHDPLDPDDDHNPNPTAKRRNIIHLSERQWRERDTSDDLPLKAEVQGIGPEKAIKDWRFGRIKIESFDPVPSPTTTNGKEKEVIMEGHGRPAASLGPNLGGMGQNTKGRYIPAVNNKNTEAGWGIVHLYREADEFSALNSQPPLSPPPGLQDSGVGEEGTVLCIPAVPSYMSPSDFLGFIGEPWRGSVSHYRMVSTSRMNRYMVLMKFTDKKTAAEWRREFDGRPFDTLAESEICHVTFIKSITVETPGRKGSNGQGAKGQADTPGGMINSLRPFPPPTPSLVELPTCAVCLERMDDTAGLMTILCQHVFHCTCLQTWKTRGCPICRATNPLTKQQSEDGVGDGNPYAKPFGHGVSNLCSVCDAPDNLWICLICGNVGCGRYERGHAKEHWKETAHSFSLELVTQHVWDYAGDMWVHRLIRDKGDGKVVELPSREGNNNEGREGGRNNNGEDMDVVPRAKLDNIGLEYTHLLTSQLESQRVYFEEMVNKAADKAAKAAAAAESASNQAQAALKELAELREEHRIMKEETVPSLEKDLAREKARGQKSTELARSLSKALQEEKQVSKGLMDRIEHMKKEGEKNAAMVEELKQENEGLKEMNHDLTMFISGQEKLKEMEKEGKLEEGELEEGTVGVAEGSKKKKKGKGKK